MSGRGITTITSTNLSSIPSAEKPKTLADILAWLDGVDQGVMHASYDQMVEFGELLTAKVDDTHNVIEEMEYQAERLRVASAKLNEGKRIILNRVTRLKNYISFHMGNHGFERIPGDLWRLRLLKSKAVETFKDPEPKDLERYGRFIRTKYEWDKTALKAALEVQDADASVVAKLVENSSVTFDVNKGKLLND
jgi:hypothetical protein